MNRWRGIRAAAGIAGAAGLAGLFAFSGPIAVKLPFALLAAGGWFLSMTADHRLKEAEAGQRMMKVLNRHRHDWMNDLQVLFGYVRLKKYDNLPDCMDKIKTKALHDSYLSRLGIPELIVYFLNLRVKSGPCALEIEIEDEIDLRQLVLGETRVYKLIRGLTDCFMEAAGTSLGESHLLSIGFDREAGHLVIDFVYNGPADKEALRTGVRSLLNRWRDTLEVREEEYGEDQAVVAVALPMRT